jgi:hypothetical protein
MRRDFTEPAAAFATLVALRSWRAVRQPEQRTHTYLVDAEVDGDHLTHATLDRQTRTIENGRFIATNTSDAS